MERRTGGAVRVKLVRRESLDRGYSRHSRTGAFRQTQEMEILPVERGLLAAEAVEEEALEEAVEEAVEEAMEEAMEEALEEAQE
jgi:hypothetical protein